MARRAAPARLLARLIASLPAPLLALSAAGASAHDTWFEVQPGAARGEQRLALGTGNRFPVHEVSVGAASLVAAQCRDVAGRSLPLRAGRDSARALRMGVRAAPGTALTCWARQAEQALTLAPALIDVYLDEIRAPAAVRERRAAMAARGLPWHETYTKHARVELGAGVPQPVPLGLDIVLDAAVPPAGGTVAFQVLSRGRPLPQFAVELVHAGSGVGFWMLTDDAGRARVPVPLPGDWLLRGTHLRPHSRQADAWESDFVTLAFGVLPAPRLL
jgi:Domain of unknown function (DUF4198)